MPSKPYARTDQVQTTLRPEERRRLDDYAAGRVSSRADAMRQLLLLGLDEVEASPVEVSVAVPESDTEKVQRQIRELNALRRAQRS